MTMASSLRYGALPEQYQSKIRIPSCLARG